MKTWRRLGMGLATVLGLGRRGFFIPYRYAGLLPRERPPYGDDAFVAARGGFHAHIAAMDGFAADLERIGVDAPPEPRWGQDWFPRLDAAAAYAMVRTREPSAIVEVGSGHSTRFMARAVRDGGLQTRITAIDPAPRATLGGLGIDLIESTVQGAGEAPFSGLAPGDVLSMDSSHVLMPGSDVDFLLNRVLPSLEPGVLIHIHDVFLPDDYPPEWGWRGYNEQLCVAPLIGGGAYRVLWSSHYVATRMARALEGTVLSRLEIPEGAHESSFWLCR